MSNIASEAAAGSSLGPADDRPLNDQEFQLLQRLLSDPFSLPMPFKSWLVSYLETSDMNLPISAVNGLMGILGIAGIGGGTLGIFPAGVILPYGGGAAPSGSLLCDGASYDTTVQNRLFAAIGYGFGGAPGGPNFNVPDFRGRSPVGVGTHADVNTVGKNDGVAVANRRPKHQHSGGNHSHTLAGHRTVYSMTGMTGFDVAGINDFSIWAGAGGNVGAVTSRPSDVGTDVASLTIGASPSDSMDAPPYETCNFVIVN